MTTPFEKRSAISGIGQSTIGRRLNRDPLALTVDACLAAISDAGLRRDDIDGIAAFPGNIAAPPGYAGPPLFDVQDALRLKPTWSTSGMETTGSFGPLINACLAVASGLCRHVLVYCTVWESTAQGQKGRGALKPLGAERATGALSWSLPFRAYSPANWAALYAQAHFDRYGTTRAQLGAVAVNARKNAMKNPAAIYREPLTLDDYLASRMISSPLCLYDCDVPADGSVALIVSSAEAARDLRRSPIVVEAIGCAHRGRPSWDQWDDLTTMALRDSAAMLWNRTSLKPADVDVAELYDGFSVLTLFWLEALGFCKKGEGGAFLDGGARIALDGDIPLNTGGGQMSAGRLNGYGLLHEACVQLWGDGGERQVSGANVALASSGGGPYTGCLLLTNA